MLRSANHLMNTKRICTFHSDALNENLEVRTLNEFEDSYLLTIIRTNSLNQMQVPIVAEAKLTGNRVSISLTENVSKANRKTFRTEAKQALMFWANDTSHEKMYSIA
ncbi:hypothetical protein C1E23_01770 [Pseudoalteromonas phenolica]|uniref:Uncharacterized protein n=1 Tax=Pseudoalteromonas phenolica TaxID=161398 RepID=A0A4Q7IS73_9GAMM|nr:hypothetical protein [Pseudoalteromonas phenolica]RZQ54851.1 hypothetical protein C1E23_01770 [Pseudoalteromonas phenolica]